MATVIITLLITLYCILTFLVALGFSAADRPVPTLTESIVRVVQAVVIGAFWPITMMFTFGYNLTHIKNDEQ